jgi:gas vesicle protein
MSRDDGTAAGTVILSFVLGAVTGAAVALLMAPVSGEETRRLLSERAREGRERAEEAARQGKDFLNRQRETLNSAVERGREAYNQARAATPPPPQAPGTPDTL